ncbi:MAG TPA: hypothetical protein VF941_17735, partial [Clostridia bacterium]
QKTLTDYIKRTDKKAWVFFKGTSNRSYMESGVKYISTAPADAGRMSSFNSDFAGYVLVTAGSGEVTYEFKPVIDN